MAAETREEELVRYIAETKETINEAKEDGTNHTGYDRALKELEYELYELRSPTEITEVTITEDMLRETGFELEELDEAISDMISNVTGFCHKGFTYEIKVSAELDKSE